MDKNTIIGFALILAILVGFSWWTKPSEEEIARQQAYNDSIAAVQAQKAMEQERQLNDINSRASQLTQRQSELAQDLINQQQRAAIPQFDENLLLDSIDSISSEINEESA